MSALKGRRLLVVGGAAGIGLATVRQCVEAGAQTAVLDRDAWTAGGAPTDNLGRRRAVDDGVVACDRRRIDRGGLDL